MEPEEELELPIGPIYTLPVPPSCREDIFWFPEGYAMISWTDRPLSPESIEELTEWLALMARKVKRGAK